MADPNPLSIRTPNHILPPTPSIPAPLIQLHPTQRSTHLQPHEPRRLGVARGRLRFAVPHHHRPETLTRKRRMREDGPDAGAVDAGVAFGRHPERGRGIGAAVQSAAEGPAAASGDSLGVGEWVEDVICSGNC